MSHIGAYHSYLAETVKEWDEQAYTVQAALGILSFHPQAPKTVKVENYLAGLRRGTLQKRTITAGK